MSLIVSLLALVVALTGTAAAAGLAANSVGSKQLKKNAVKTAKIKNNAVTAAKIKAGAVTGQEIADGSVTSAEVMDGSLGAADLAAGVLPTKSVSYDHLVDLDGPDPAQLAVGGVSFDHGCSDVGGGDQRIQTFLGAVAPGAKIVVSGTQVEWVGGVTESIVYTTLPPGSTTVFLNGEGSAGSMARWSFEGTVQADGQPVLRISLVGALTNGATECLVRGLITPQ
ncbi:hypothetical protein [Nocardioides dilutus]